MSDSPASTTAVFLHGQPGVGADWCAVVEGLPAAVRAVAPDRPGYGDNPEPAGTLMANNQWLADYLLRNGIERPVLVGHSYGGGVALVAAIHRSRPIHGLVLVNSIGPDCLTWWDEVLAAPVAGPVLSLAAWSTLPALARRASWLATTGWTALGRVHAVHWSVWRSVLAEQRELLRIAPLWPTLLPRVDVPTLIIADPHDAVVPVSTAYALRERIPDARLELVDGGGHQLPQRIAPVLAAKIGSFVDSIR